MWENMDPGSRSMGGGVAGEDGTPEVFRGVSKGST
jgi:hypothetical protein